MSFGSRTRCRSTRSPSASRSARRRSGTGSRTCPIRRSSSETRPDGAGPAPPPLKRSARKRGRSVTSPTSRGGASSRSSTRNRGSVTSSASTSARATSGTVSRCAQQLESKGCAAGGLLNSPLFDQPSRVLASVPRRPGSHLSPEVLVRLSWGFRGPLHLHAEVQQQSAEGPEVALRARGSQRRNQRHAFPRPPPGLDRSGRGRLDRLALSRGVAQPGQSIRSGSEGPGVRIPPPRSSVRVHSRDGRRGGESWRRSSIRCSRMARRSRGCASARVRDS